MEVCRVAGRPATMNDPSGRENERRRRLHWPITMLKHLAAMCISFVPSRRHIIYAPTPATCFSVAEPMLLAWSQGNCSLLRLFFARITQRQPARIGFLLFISFVS